MKRQLEYVLMLALGAGTLSATAMAKDTRQADRQNPQVEPTVLEPGSGAQLLQTDWDDRRCDGDHDRDDRHCYDRDDRYYRDNRDYRAYPGYSNGYYATPYYPPAAGWYDRDGRWHAYDRDRDQYRRHDNDDRR